MAAVPSIGRANRVETAAAPEADATRALYERYANQIFRYCLHQLGSREEAEDAVQSTFLNAFRGIRRGVVPEVESAWLFKIAHNVCLSRRRATWRRGRIESPADFELVEELTPAPSRRADELMGLQDVLEGLPENQRRAILLREWQGLSYREISEELDLSQAAVETLIFRARRALASGLEQPPEPKRRRLLGGTAGGNLLAGLKSVLFGGSVAAKVAAVAVVTATTVVGAQPTHHRHAAPPRPHGQPVAQQASQPVVPETAVAVLARPEPVLPQPASTAPRHARPAHAGHTHGAVGASLAAHAHTRSAKAGAARTAPPGLTHTPRVGLAQGHAKPHAAPSVKPVRTSTVHTVRHAKRRAAPVARGRTKTRTARAPNAPAATTTDTVPAVAPAHSHGSGNGKDSAGG